MYQILSSLDNLIFSVNLYDMGRERKVNDVYIRHDESDGEPGLDNATIARMREEAAARRPSAYRRLRDGRVVLDLGVALGGSDDEDGVSLEKVVTAPSWFIPATSGKRHTSAGHKMMPVSKK